ncbi:MAG: hypothetical protein QOI09_2438, partial [Chloroflexota bacterium]|nr:hypothetical protein [Chloroflexota bacterium]
MTMSAPAAARSGGAAPRDPATAATG